MRREGGRAEAALREGRVRRSEGVRVREPLRGARVGGVQGELQVKGGLRESEGAPSGRGSG